MASNLQVFHTYTETLNSSDEKPTSLKIPQTFTEILGERGIDPSLRPSMMYAEVISDVALSNGVLGKKVFVSQMYAEILMSAVSKKRSNPHVVQFDAMKREI